MKHKFTNKNKGFSLVELIIVIAIMAILAATIAPALIRYVDKARKVKILAEAKLIYDTCNLGICEFTTRLYNGKYYGLEDAMVKRDPVYGKVGRVSCGMCNEMTKANPSSFSTAHDLVDSMIALRIIEQFPQYESEDYGAKPPYNQLLSSMSTSADFKGRFVFMSVYNQTGCLYVEYYHNGYFVHFDGNQTEDDVIKANQNPNMRFTNAN